MVTARGVPEQTSALEPAAHAAWTTESYVTPETAVSSMATAGIVVDPGYCALKSLDASSRSDWPFEPEKHALTLSGETPAVAEHAVESDLASVHVVSSAHLRKATAHAFVAPSKDVPHWSNAHAMVFSASQPDSSTHVPVGSRTAGMMRTASVALKAS